ncbi:MAG TPA: transglycosylase SLT domain-containing protein [Polyangia bacterium]|nr:transglycosylase SLT domain-containing protein [Polyangia bacterium]
MDTLVLLLALGCPAQGAFYAQPVQVTPALVCAAQHAIRWRDAAWTVPQCDARTWDFKAAGLRWGVDPAQLLAMAIAESDLRVEAIRDNGNGDRPAVDVGLMAVRCILSPDVSHDKCRNKPVRGLDIPHLMRPSTNIDMGARILATLHRGSLRSYNGGTREHGYAGKISAIMSALGGVEMRVEGKRLRELVKRLARAQDKLATEKP